MLEHCPPWAKIFLWCLIVCSDRSSYSDIVLLWYKVCSHFLRVLPKYMMFYVFRAFLVSFCRSVPQEFLWSFFGLLGELGVFLQYLLDQSELDSLAQNLWILLLHCLEKMKLWSYLAVCRAICLSCSKLTCFHMVSTTCLQSWEIHSENFEKY